MSETIQNINNNTKSIKELCASLKEQINTLNILQTRNIVVELISIIYFYELPFATKLSVYDIFLKPIIHEVDIDDYAERLMSSMVRLPYMSTLLHIKHTSPFKYSITGIVS